MTVGMSPHCPFCREPGRLALADCRDAKHRVAGSWQFYECVSCGSRWIHPRPARDQIPTFYPSSYTFIRQEPSDLLAGRSDFRTQVKRGLLHTHYGYPQPLGARSFIERLAVGVAGWFRTRVRQAGLEVRFAPLKPSGKLLDIGSGSGSYLLTMKNLGWDVEGVEPDNEAAEVSRKCGLNVRHGMLEETTLPSRFYDVVTMYHVFEHLFDLDLAAAKLWEITRPGGLVVSISPNPRSASALYFGRMWSALEPPRHLFLPTVEGYKRLLGARGFKVSCFSLSRLRRWIVPESVCVRRTGNVEGQKRDIWTIGHRSVVTLLALALRDSGEEVVCIARKPIE